MIVHWVSFLLWEVTPEWRSALLLCLGGLEADLLNIVIIVLQSLHVLRGWSLEGDLFWHSNFCSYEKWRIADVLAVLRWLFCTAKFMTRPFNLPSFSGTALRVELYQERSPQLDKTLDKSLPALFLWSYFSYRLSLRKPVNSLSASLGYKTLMQIHASFTCRRHFLRDVGTIPLKCNIQRRTCVHLVIPWEAATSFCTSLAVSLSFVYLDIEIQGTFCCLRY